jgi:CelD/BcsL family acetyltransferase involved in cellulose biosynthesis
MEVRILKSYDELVGLKPEWNQLLSRYALDNVFSTCEWHTSWWRSFGQGSQLNVITARDESGSLLGLAPLRLTAGSEERLVCFLGGVDVSDYMDIIVDSSRAPETLDAFATHLHQTESSWDRLDLHNIPDRSATRDKFRSLLEGLSFRTDSSAEERCPKISLPGDWEGYMAQLGKKDRHELRRKIRRLEGSGTKVTWHISDAHTLEADLEAFFELHRRSMLDKADFMDEPMQAFFRDFCRVLLDAGWLKLFMMELDGEAAATIMCFDYKDAFFVYNSGYDPRFGSLSVGIVLMAYCVQEAIREGRKTFDFLRGDEPYKYTFGAADEPIYRLVVESHARQAAGESN